MTKTLFQIYDNAIDAAIFYNHCLFSTGKASIIEKKETESREWMLSTDSRCDVSECDYIKNNNRNNQNH